MDQIYKKIPNFKCKEGCSDCCGPVPTNAEERKRIGGAIGVNKDSLVCEHSSPEGCLIYEDRPFVCRIFGTTPSEPMLKCPHGCAPLFPLIKESESELTAQYMKTEGVETPKGITQIAGGMLLK